MPTLMITPEARGCFRWIDETYRIGDEVKEWCRKLADRAVPPTDGSFDFTALWEEAGKIAANPDEESIARAVAVVGKQLYDRIRDQLARRGARIQVLAASQVFRALSDHRFEVEVTAVYEADPAAGTVAFLFFDTCTAAADHDDPADPAVRRPW